MNRYRYWSEDKRRLYWRLLNLTNNKIYPDWLDNPSHVEKVKKLGADLFDCRLPGDNIYSVEDLQGRMYYATDTIKELADYLKVTELELYNQFMEYETRDIHSIRVRGKWVTRERIKED